MQKIYFYSVTQKIVLYSYITLIGDEKMDSAITPTH